MGQKLSLIMLFNDKVPKNILKISLNDPIISEK